MTDALVVPRRQGQRPLLAHEQEWTPERVDQLKRLWADGRSQSEIAVELGLNSRGAVAGKAHRLGLSSRKDQAVGHRWRGKSTIRKHRLQACETVAEAPVEGRCDLEHLDGHMCRFPYGEGPFLFCGEIIAGGASYCAAHHRIAYRSESTIG